MTYRHIAVFLPSLNGGGAERIMVTLANAFANRSYRVDLVLAEAQGPYLKDVSPGVRVVNLKAGRVVKALLPLIAYLRKERPAALLSAMSHANVVALVACAAGSRSARLVVSERGTISGEYKVARGFISRLVFWVLPFLYRRADGITAVSKAAAGDLARFTSLPESRITTIYNPFDLGWIERRAMEPLTHPWFRPNQVPVILAIGRLNEAKDFPVLLQAFSYLRRTHQARLMILGEGELRGELERLALDCGLSGDDIQIPGFVDNPYAYLARCRLFVLSSRREGLPGALIEAMACGAPVVSTDCLSGPAEILEDGRWGRLVPVGDVKALSQAMVVTLDARREELPDVRQRARDFEQARAVDAYLALLGMQS